MIYTFLRGVGHRFIGNRMYLVIFKMVTCNCGVTCYGNSKVRLACCASWCHVSLLGAVSFEPDRGLILPFLLPPPGREYKRGGCLWWTGSFFLKREATQGVGWEGSESGRLWCDKTDRNILPSRVEMSGRGSLSGADGTITLQSQGGIHRGGEKLRDSGEDLALWSWLSCQLGSFLYNRTMVSWDDHTICTILSFLFH